MPAARASRRVPRRLLRRLPPLLRAAFPRVRFLVRLDGGFATPALFDFLDAEPRLDYVVAMAKNAVLVRRAEPAMEVARGRSEVSGETAHVYTDTRYAARTWGGARRVRRVVIKAEVVRLGDRKPRDNPRFVVTNMRQTPRFIYEKVYCARGDIENRIKELLDGLQIDRTSCSLFSANQFRVLLTAAAYVLMQELRLRAARTACARTRVSWLRDRLLKLGCTLSARRAALFCICRARRRTSMLGGISPSSSGRGPDSPPRRRNRLLAEGQKTVPGVKLSPPHRPHPPSCPPARPITPIFAGHMARSRPRVDHAHVGNRFQPLSGTPIDRFQTAMNNPGWESAPQNGFGSVWHNM